jgi:hypothetical protein
LQPVNCGSKRTGDVAQMATAALDVNSIKLPSSLKNALGARHEVEGKPEAVKDVFLEEKTD